MRDHYLIVLFFAALVTAGLAMRQPDVPAALAPVPAGWTRVTEPGSVLTIAIDGNTVWAGGKDGLFELDRASAAVRRRVDLPVEPIHIRSLAVGSEGALWIGHIDGLIKMHRGAFEKWTVHDGLPANRVNALLATEDTVMIGTAAGLAEARDGRIRTTIPSGTLTSPIVNVLFRSRFGELYVGASSDADGGVAALGEPGLRVTTRNGLPHPYVQDIVEAEDGRIWIATGQYDEGGIAIVQNGRVVKTVRNTDGLAGEKARSLGIGPDGEVWCGSESDGLAVQTQNGWRVLKIEDGLPHNEVTVIRCDQDGAMWLGGLNGVVKIEREAARRITRG